MVFGYGLEEMSPRHRATVGLALVLSFILGLLLAGCGNEVAQLKPPDAQSWPQSRRNSARDASIQKNVHIPLELVWEEEIDKTATSYLSPVCAGSFYVMSIEGEIWCYHADSGKIIWKSGVNGAGVGLPKIENDHVICMAVYPPPPEIKAIPAGYRFKCDLVCFNLNTGKKAWQFHVPSRLDYQMVEDFCVSAGRVYLVDNDSRMTVLDARTGKKIEEKRIFENRYVAGPPLLDNGKLFLATGNRGSEYEHFPYLKGQETESGTLPSPIDIPSDTSLVSMIDAATGSVAWEGSFDYPVQLAGVAGGRVIIVPRTFTGVIIAADADTGNIAWRYSIPPHTAPKEIAYSPNTSGIIFTYVDVAEPVNLRYLTSLDASTGKEQWKTLVKPSGRVDRPVVFGDYGAAVLSLGKEDGIIIFRCRDGEIVQHIRITNRRILFGFVLASDSRVFTLMEVPQEDSDDTHMVIGCYK